MATKKIKDKNKKAKKSYPAPKLRKRLSLMLVFGGLIVIASSIILLYIRQNKTATITDGSSIAAFDQIVTENSDDPDERKPDIKSVIYEVQSDAPRRIIIPAIGVDGFIQQVGTTKENAVAVPTNIHIGGWFDDSVKPGQNGLSIIDGHVSGRYTDGIFKRLGELKSGEKFQIEYGDRSTKTFEIVENRKLTEADSSNFLFQKTSQINSQLNLITCGGNFDKNTEEYADRIVIVSKLIES
jgi:LPXTG-site transpeptidase (sortase) family protein